MKKRGMKKRVLAALMTACMVVGSVPGGCYYGQLWNKLYA